MNLEKCFFRFKTMALMKTEATSDFHRESGMVRARQMTVDFLSLLSRKPQRLLPQGKIHPVGVSRVCYVSA